MKTPYDDETFPDLEVLALRKKIQELEKSLSEAHAILREHDLLDAKSHISDEEYVCTTQIAKYKELTEKKIPLQFEDVKQFEILVKSLLAIRGKAPVDEGSKRKKKVEKPNLKDLLKIVNDSPKVENDE